MEQLLNFMTEIIFIGDIGDVGGCTKVPGGFNWRIYNLIYDFINFNSEVFLEFVHPLIIGSSIQLHSPIKTHKKT